MAALESIRQASCPSEVKLHEIPAPTRVASFAVALEANAFHPDGEAAALGSLILLHEPGGHTVWEGDFRAVTVAKTRLEDELGADPCLAEVAWSWLVEALEGLDLVGRPAGTVTRTASESFGSLKDRANQVGLEVRASWTPAGPQAGRHLEAWLDFLAMMGGVQLLPTGVTSLRSHR